MTRSTALALSLALALASPLIAACEADESLVSLKYHAYDVCVALCDWRAECVEPWDGCVDYCKVQACEITTFGCSTMMPVGAADECLADVASNSCEADYLPESCRELLGYPALGE